MKNVVTDLHNWLVRNHVQDGDAELVSTKALDMYTKLQERLSNFQVALANLKSGYYEMRYQRQQLTGKPTHKHGSITVRSCYLNSTNELVVEVLNARNLKSYDSNSKLLYHFLTQIMLIVRFKNTSFILICRFK